METRPEITIRRAAAEDAALLAEMGERTFRDAFAADNRPEDMDAYVASAFNVNQLNTELTDPLSIFFVAEAAGRAVGYAKLYEGEPADGVTGPSAIELARLYALQEWHGRGVGPELMRACLDEARRRGHQTIWLGVWEHNTRALAFYRRLGFREVGTHIFVVGFDQQTDMVMERALTDQPDRRE